MRPLVSPLTLCTFKVQQTAWFLMVLLITLWSRNQWLWCTCCSSDITKSCIKMPPDKIRGPNFVDHMIGQEKYNLVSTDTFRTFFHSLYSQFSHLFTDKLCSANNPSRTSKLLFTQQKQGWLYLTIFIPSHHQFYGLSPSQHFAFTLYLTMSNKTWKNT